MKLIPIKTPIVNAHDDLFKIITTSVPTIKEYSVLAVTSKIVALCEGNISPVVTGSREEKHAIVRAEADAYIEASNSKYDVMLAIKDQVLAVNAGVDMSNANNQYVKLPKESYKSASILWNDVKNYYRIKNLGILITDSKTIPLKWGTIGTALAHCGFKGVRNRIGEKDLFGYEMQMTQVNIAEALAVSAVLSMGEVAEQQPLCLIEEIPQIEFQDQPPTLEEIKALEIAIEDDVYAPILQSAPWKRNT
jgi:putative folate metabolism gamma-glutamate ligase